MGNTVRKFFNAKEQKRKRQYLRNNATQAEQILWAVLRKKQLSGYKFRRQHGIGPYITDFYCPEVMLAIEADDGIHDTARAIEYDRNRDVFFRSHGITTLRFRNEEIMNDVNEVLRAYRTSFEFALEKRKRKIKAKECDI